jgi:two-component system, NtrC family, sensor histidine kinase GlrK
MKLRTRYLLSLLALVGLMTIPALYGVGRTHALRSIALDLRHQAARTSVAAGRLSRAAAELDRHQRTYVATAEPEVLGHVRSSLDVMQAQIDSLGGLGYRDLVSVELPVRWLRDATDTLQVLVEQGSLEKATAYFSNVARPLFDSLDRSILGLSAAVDDRSAARAAEAQQLASRAVVATTSAIILVLLVAGLMAWLAAHLLTRPLERLSRAMMGVSEGRLDGPADPALARNDEVGDLFRSLHTMSERLAHLDRMKVRFTSMASHDLKNPISVIIGYAELLEEAGDPLPPRQRKVLESLQVQARLLAERLDQLVEISRMEARALRLGLEEIHIRHFAAGLESLLAPAAHRDGVDLAVSVAPDAPSFIVADPDCLRSQIMGNLVGHAIRFSPPGAVVRVDFRGGGGRCLIEVRDQGPTVPPEAADRIFDPYDRDTGSPRAGMALPIVRAGVKAHGGTVSVHSDASGTTFVLDLPVRPSAEGSAERETLVGTPKALEV